jgi:hypothetical protein
MTLPHEEYNSLISAKNFLYDLLNPKETPGVPSDIRARARRILKHYPMNITLDEFYKDHLPKTRSILSEYENGGGWGKGKDE